jgi:hypothetical protein
MKQVRILFLLATLCLQFSLKAYAYDFKVNGIAYNITSTSILEVEAVGDWSDTDFWKEIIAIPTSVSYEGITYQVTSINSSLFSQGWGNTVLKEVYLPNGIKAIPEKCFSSCENLVTIILPNALESIGKRAFNNCSSLEHLDIPNSVKSIGSEAFRICRKLKDIKLPSEARNIGPGIFEGCTSLTSIFIPQHFGCDDNFCLDRAFVGCNLLKTVIFDKDYNEKGLSCYLGIETFLQCENLKSVTLSNNITAIGMRTFADCTSLTEFTFPQNEILHIDGESFLGCSQLKKIISPNETPPYFTGNKIFSGTTLLNGTLYVPKGCVSAYRAADGWKEFVNIKEIGDEESFTLTAYCGKGGSIEIDGQKYSDQISAFNVSMNQSVMVSIIPDNGYSIKSVTLNGKEVKDDLYNNTYTIAQIKEDIDFRVEFAKVATFLSLKQPTGSMDIVVKEGESQTIRLVPESGYTIHSVTYNGKDVTNQLSEDNTFVTPVITDNSVLYVTYENGENPPVNHDKYLTIKHSENGDVKQKITPGRSYTYKISPVSGQKLTALYFNGVDVSSEIKGGKYTTPVLNDNATLEVEFEAE